MRSLRFAALLGAMFATAAYGQKTVYVGIGLGSFDYQENLGDGVIGKVSDTASSQKLFGGFEINDHFAIEIVYGTTSDLHYSVSGNDSFLGDYSYSLTTDFKMTNLRALGQMPFDWGALMAGLGYFSSENRFSETAMTGCCGSGTGGNKFNDDGLSAMLGVEWRFGRFGTRFGVRFEYEWWDISGVDISSLGLGFSYGF